MSKIDESFEQVRSTIQSLLIEIGLEEKASFELADYCTKTGFTKSAMMKLGIHNNIIEQFLNNSFAEFTASHPETIQEIFSTFENSEKFTLFFEKLEEIIKKETGSTTQTEAPVVAPGTTTLQ